MTGVKKLRGGKRYYKGLRERASTFGLDLDSGRTYDLWHKHFDWHGHSRRGVRHRAEHLAALFVAFKRALVETSASSVPAQVFVSLAPACHSEQDALYVHTPNPNGTPFPHSFNGVRWDIATQLFFVGLSMARHGKSARSRAKTKDGGLSGHVWEVRFSKPMQPAFGFGAQATSGTEVVLPPPYGERQSMISCVGQKTTRKSRAATAAATRP